MQGGSGKDEAGGVEVTGGDQRHFRTMGEAVEEGEEADDRSAGPKGKADGKGDEEAEEEDGRKDTGFHHGKLKARHAKGPAQGHDTDEAGRDGPDSAAAQLSGPKADGDHGEEVIQAEDGMSDAIAEPMEVPEACVGVSQRRQEKGEQQGQGFPGHGRRVSFEERSHKGKIRA